MRALADENMTGLAETFGRHLDLRLAPGRTLSRHDLGDAEVLLVRSVTRVDADLLQGSAVRFVGTATIGTDHLDTDWLDSAGIAWANAPGCNADAAAEYTLGMMLLACRRLDRNLSEQRIAIVGHGNVGSRLHRLLDAWGAEVLVCDPPLEAVGDLDGAPLQTALEADLVSLHVPLVHDGPWPTAGMLGTREFDRMREDALLVNTARGGVVDGDALLEALSAGRIHAALDVWPREPEVDTALLSATTVATPHVAGYSVEGKQRGTRMIYEAFLEWSHQVPPPGLGSGAEGASAIDPQLRLPADLDDPLAAAVIGCTKVEQDDRRMRDSAAIDAAAFDGLRRAHAPRHEFGRVRVHARDGLAPRLRGLGFGVTPGMAPS